MYLFDIKSQELCYFYILRWYLFCNVDWLVWFTSLSIILKSINVPEVKKNSNLRYQDIDGAERNLKVIAWQLAAWKKNKNKKNFWCFRHNEPLSKQTAEQQIGSTTEITVQHFQDKWLVGLNGHQCLLELHTASVFICCEQQSFSLDTSPTVLL